MSSAGLDEIIDIGNNLTTRKYYTIATTTIFFYDFLLTLADEIKYGWKGRKSWVFAIFLANRYLPVGYQIWMLYTSYNTTFHQRLQLCDETVFFDILIIAILTFLAQVVLTLRIYAVTRKNRIIASCFSIIMISQLSIGLYGTVDAAKTGSSPILQVPLPIYMTCTVVGRLSMATAFTVLSFAYDLLAFLVIVFLVVRSNVTKVPIPGILKTIVRDATYYFLAISISHLVTVIFLWFASGVIKWLPAPYLPVMITRLLLSLKKANASGEHGWSFGEPTTHTTMRFAERQGGGTTRDEVPLDTFASTQEGIQSQE